MFKRSAGWIAGWALVVLGCSEPDRQAEVDEIVENLLQAGFPRSDIQIVEGRVYVGRDAEVGLAASREIVATPPETSQEQYRTTNLVASSVRTICVNGAAFTGAFSAPLEAALANYNSEALSFHLVRTSGSTTGCDAIITANLIGGTGGVAGFPSGGLPYPQINIGTGVAGYGAAVLEHVITHELGHTIGLRHTDFYNRSISCGVGGNEGDAGVGAIHIPGTPTNATVGGSVMNSCYRTTETGNLAMNDILAVRALYPWREPTSWSANYSNAGGWAATEAYWSTIAFPDLNGDGRGDVCGRSSAGLVCSLSNDAGFVTPFPAGAFSDGSGWAAAKYYWGTIRYPDLNGDGRADVCGRSGAGPVCSLSTGTSFAPESLWQSAYSDAGAWNTDEAYWGTLRHPDLNGDGRDDLCGRAADGLYCALSTGSSFASPSFWTTAYSNAGAWNTSPSHWATIEYPDLNGDGRDDVCGRASNGIYCALSTGSSFATPTFWSSNFSDTGSWNSSKAYWGTIRYPDLNGDGRADICGRAGAGLLCATSTGSSFASPSLWTSAFSDTSGWLASEVYWGTIIYADLDGDNRDDACGRGVAGIYCTRSTGSSFTAGSFASSGFSDYAGWNTFDGYWKTIRMPDLDGNGHADVCGRASAGIHCAKL